MLLEIYKTFLYILRFLSKKNFKSQTYSNWVACTTEKKPLATFIVRGNQIWVEACFCLIASIRLVDGKKPQDAKIVKSEEAPPYNGKTLLQVIFNQIDTFFFLIKRDNLLSFCLHVNVYRDNLKITKNLIKNNL